jgi:hypothetical protein
MQEQEQLERANLKVKRDIFKNGLKNCGGLPYNPITL